MHIRRKIILTISTFLFLMSIVIVVGLQERSRGFYGEQVSFLQAQGFLRENDKAIYDYIKAADLLKEKSIYLKSANELNCESGPSECFYNTESVSLILQGAKQIQLGLPTSSSQLFWEDSYIIDGHRINVDDLYLCVDYICSLLKYNNMPADKNADKDIAYVSFAMGVQMSQYKDQVLHAYSLACKYYALNWLVNHSEKQQTEYNQLERFFRNTKIEYEHFRKEPVHWPIFIEISMFIYRYKIIWLVVGMSMLYIVFYIWHKKAKEKNKV